MRLFYRAVFVCGLAFCCLVLSPATAQQAERVAPPWVYVGPFNQDGGFTWRSIIGMDSSEVLENSILITLMAIITIATLRTNYRLKQSRRELEKSNTKLKKALQELENKEEQIIKQERLRALGEMAGGVAHDFNNALQPIVLAADVLNRRRHELSDDPKLQSYVQVIHMSAREAAGTVKRLVRFFRPGKGHDKKLFDPGPLIEEVVELTRPKWKEDAQLKGVTIDFKIEIEPGGRVYGYPDEFREMLVNLVFNAVDAIERDGRISITSRLEDESLLLRVADSGCGMPREVSSKCLEPFFTTKANRGTGLGLSIVYGVVRRMKGGIYIDSAPGQGTTFTIRLPLAREELLQAEQDSKGRVRRKTAAPRELRFLLAEDNAAVRSMLCEELQQLGHEVVLAVSGNQAWGLYQKGGFDIVLTDQAMPGMSGRQLARLIKDDNPKMPVLMLSGFGDMALSDKERAYVDALISKPVALADVMRNVSEIMGINNDWRIV
jgi:signal transduction histidine kinase/CheY-like chemotaxis protein